MHVTNVGSYPLTIGGLIALIVLLLAILGLVGVLPWSAPVGFGLVGVLAIARLT